MKFKIGDIVKYVSGNHGDYDNNPLWGGKHGKVTGVIVEDKGKGVGLSIKVNWDNDTHNSYEENDLELAYKFGEVKEIEKMFDNILDDI